MQRQFGQPVHRVYGGVADPRIDGQSAPAGQGGVGDADDVQVQLAVFRQALGIGDAVERNGAAVAAGAFAAAAVELDGAVTVGGAGPREVASGGWCCLLTTSGACVMA